MARNVNSILGMAARRKKEDESTLGGGYTQPPSNNYQNQRNSVSSVLYKAAIRKEPEETQTPKRYQQQKQTTSQKDTRGAQYVDAVGRLNRERSNAVTDVIRWSKNVRTSDVRNASALHQQSDDFETFFRQNQDLFDRGTLNQVKTLLNNGRMMLQQKDPSITMNGAQRVDYIQRLKQQMAADDRDSNSLTRSYRNTAEGQTRHDDAEARLDALRAQNAELKRQNKIREYQQSAEGLDGTYRTTANGKKQEYGFGGKMTETGFRDPLYDYINKNPNAEFAHNVNTSYGDLRAGTDQAELLQMNDAEVQTFNALYSRNRDEAMDYIETIRPELRARQAETERKEWSQFARENPVFSSILSVPNNLVSSIDSLIGMGVDKISGNEIDPNAGYLRGRRAQNAIRGTVGEMTGNALADVAADAAGSRFNDDMADEVRYQARQKFGNTIQKLGETTYGSIMSMLDNMMNVALVGGAPMAALSGIQEAASLALMSTTAMPDAIVSGKERGLSDRDAFGLGVIAGVAEYFTEKVSLEALFDMESIAKRGLMKYIGKAAFTEGSEEVASDFINFMAQELIAGERSDFNETVKAYQRQGMSHEEAVKAAWADQVEQSAYSFLGGAIAGGGAAVNLGVANQIGQMQMANTGSRIKADNPENEMIQRMGDAEVAQLAYDQQAARELENRGMAAADQAADQIDAGEKVNPALTEYLMQNENALGTLEEATGSEEIQTEEQLMAALETYATERKNAQITDEGTRTMLDNDGNASVPVGDYVSARPYLSAAVSDDAIARTFGEEGAKIYKDIESRAVAKGLTPQQAYQEISQVYNAGTNRKNIGRVTNLSSADVDAVFKAGYQDSFRYAQNDETKISFAAASGGSGVVGNDLVKSLMTDPKTAKKVGTMNRVAQALGIRVNYVEQLRDSNGKKINANGYFNPHTKEIYISAGAQEGATLAWVFGHEMTHRLQQVAPSEYNTLKQSVQTALGARFNLEVQRELNLALRDGFSMSQQQAQDEAVANFVGELVRDRNALDSFINQNKNTEEGKSLLRRIRDFFRNLLNKISRAYGEVDIEVSDPIQRTIDALTAAIETGAENVAAYDGTNESMEIQDDGSVLLSISSYENTGKNEYEKYLNKLVEKGEFSRDEADDMLEEIDTIYKVCKEYADTGKYVPFTAWSNADVIYNKDGKPVFSAIKANSEYKMNIDFSTICKKRRTLDAVFRRMIVRGMLEKLDLNKEESAAMVVNINNLIRKHGFEAACALCFVEARRYRQQQTATTFRDMWNGLVESMYKDKSKIAYFNYGEDKTVKDVPDGIHTMDDKDLNLSKVRKIANAKNDKGKPVQTAEAKAARLILNDPSQRKLMRIGDMMASTGFENMQIQNPELMKVYNSKKGTGGAKSSFGDVQYLNEIIKSQTFNRDAAYAVSGVRIQSFSDYVPRMVFDYVQVIGDLAVKRLPAHAYTKEVLFVKQFGLTGTKINMSLVPDVVKNGVAPGLDAKGNYIWNDEGTFPFKEAMEIQKAEGYKENCGTIAVGISDEQIMKMLADPEIQMVIPYHKSSLNPIVAAMTNVDRFTDYTDYQNTKDAEGKTVKKDFDWDKKLFRLSHDKNGNLLPRSKWGNVQDLVKEYVDWCDKKNYTPKFSQFLYMEDGSINPGYYKMLEETSL